MTSVVEKSGEVHLAYVDQVAKPLSRKPACKSANGDETSRPLLNTSPQGNLIDIDGRYAETSARERQDEAPVGAADDCNAGNAIGLNPPDESIYPGRGVPPCTRGSSAPLW